jgi:PKD repeat protein
VVALSASIGTVTKSGTNNGTWTWSFQTSDGPSTYTVTITANDGNGGITNTTFSLAVNNVAPVVEITGAPSSSPEGSAISLGSSVSDPSQADTAAGFTYFWTVTKNGALAGSGSGPTFTFTPADNGTYGLTLNITDKDQAIGSDARIITVTNVPPTIAILTQSATAVDENGSLTLSLAFTDPGADFHTVVVNWGDGGSTSIPVAAGTTLINASHTYLDDGATGTPSDLYAIGVNVTDKDGGSASAGASVMVKNAPPVISGLTGPPGPVALGTAAAIGVAFSDAGTLDSHFCSFSWDDTTTSSVVATNGSCSASHTYTAAGVYTVLISVTDDDTGSISSKFEFLVVYDPTAGFVTGAGQINSPAGAYVADAALAGKATFGFASKYHRGAAVPSGETEFRFHVANFSFQSTDYQWLVVSGPKAQFKGSGRVNGANGYTFLITATDGDQAGGGGTDKFRIKIWNTETGIALYDNVSGSLDDIDSANPQVIEAGQIVIHSK